MPIYVYESHRGGMYFSHIKYDSDDLFCDQCHDSDCLVDEIKTPEEAIVCLYTYYRDMDIYSLYYLLNIVNHGFDCQMSEEEANNIIQEYEKEHNNV